MQVKWKCLLKRVLIPIIITMVSAIVMFGIVASAILWYSNNVVAEMEQQGYYTSNQPIYDSGCGTGFFPIAILVIIVILGIIFVKSWLRESMKPCIIKEAKAVDKIAWGLGAFIDFIQFLVCAYFFITGVIMCFACLAVTISVLTGRVGDTGIGIVIYVLTLVVFAISWVIYPYKQNDNVEEADV